jgi:hypothetical protein
MVSASFLNNMKLSHLIIICVFVSASCYDPDAYENVDASKLVWLIGNDTSVIADGKNVAIIKAQLSTTAVAGKRTIVFKTDFGKFSGSNSDTLAVVTEPPSFAAYANLVSSSAGKATVTASAQGVTAEQKRMITFTKAYPDTIIVAVPTFSVQLGFDTSVVITASLMRANGGVPSTGHPVTFTVIDPSTGASVGYFLNGQNSSATDQFGRVSVTFSAGPDTPTGFVKIIAETQGNGKIISGETRLYISE